MREPRQDRVSRGGPLDPATRVRVVQSAYSDAQHDLDTILTRPTLFDPTDPVTADFLRTLRTCEQLPREGGALVGSVQLRQGYFHRAENLLSGVIVLPDSLRAEIIEAVRKPSRIGGVMGDGGSGTSV